MAEKVGTYKRFPTHLCIVLCNYNAVYIYICIYIYMVISYDVMNVQEKPLGLNVDDLHCVLLFR
jgi:hypothetical protein